MCTGVVQVQWYRRHTGEQEYMNDAGVVLKCRSSTGVCISSIGWHGCGRSTVVHGGRCSKHV
jgi:hypothetical protein